MNWDPYPNFKESEFRCKHSGRVDMHPDFMARLQKLRSVYGAPMAITSGYRDRSHPIERRKPTPGAHTLGRACDVGIQGEEALRLVGLAIQCGFTGIGVKQHGTGRFIHLDDVPKGLPRPTIWSYP